ncbi:AAA family ATPase [Caldimonas tepidiphila]|uniref:AAA family ATPase n=1 Tax=Caldimonas tepidiphila TaxID=2315841 RepID=UPI000E5B45EE|nr:ATP-binding protein [Caldimonas tepidiphila]
MAAAPVVALLGAESTGKTTLALALATDLRAAGRDVGVVPEYLREFCDAAGRTPRPDEQTAIAAEQTRRIAEAASRHELVIADTTALMTAVYSDHLFGDASLIPGALQAHAGCALTLLTGLDLPWQADGLQRDGPQVRAPVDARIRALLQQGGLPFSVVYGRGEARVRHAMRALEGLLGRLHRGDGGSGGEPQGPVRWRLKCRDCEQADPAAEDCAHGLFGGLLNRTAGGEG